MRRWNKHHHIFFSKLDLERLILVLRTHFVHITPRIYQNCDRISPNVCSKCVRKCVFCVYVATSLFFRYSCLTITCFSTTADNIGSKYNWNTEPIVSCRYYQYPYFDSAIGHKLNLNIWQICDLYMSRNMRFPTMWYVRPAKPQISLRIRVFWSEPLLVAWIFYGSFYL